MKYFASFLPPIPNKPHSWQQTISEYDICQIQTRFHFLRRLPLWSAATRRRFAVVATALRRRAACPSPSPNCSAGCLNPMKVSSRIWTKIAVLPTAAPVARAPARSEPNRSPLGRTSPFLGRDKGVGIRTRTPLTSKFCLLLSVPVKWWGVIVEGYRENLAISLVSS